jgi:catechol 2,3-dioxygenase-like lactoylglutathione lyase family enzyme
MPMGSEASEGTEHSAPAGIGTLETVVLDTRDPRGLAGFYVRLLGARIVADEENWVTIADDSGRRISFQTSPEHTPPRFPDPAGSQQLHLDVRVTEVDDAERQVLALGATRVTESHEEDGFRVFLDPAGHPFCLVHE